MLVNFSVGCCVTVVFTATKGPVAGRITKAASTRDNFPLGTGKRCPLVSHINWKWHKKNRMP